jgi:hypothetical protein
MSTHTFQPLFLTGTVRSGTTLLARLLSVHEQVMVASDPFFPLFRHLRNALAAACSDPEVQARFRPYHPLYEAYYRPWQLKVLEALLEGGLEVPFDPALHQDCLEACRARMAAECPDLIPFLPQVPAADFRQTFDRALQIVARARDCAQRRWVGFKDVWIVDFFPLLARAYPEARFVVIVRDPRAVAASNLAFRTRDPSQMAHPLSLYRHWRKHLALLLHFQADPRLAPRLHLLRYEDLVRRPEAEVRRLCRFLGVEFDPRMLDADNYYDWARGGTWRGNSSYVSRVSGISAEFRERWRQVLSPPELALVELVCAPDMELLDYRPQTGREHLPAAVRQLAEDHAQDWAWRSDLEDPVADAGAELLRRTLLEAEEEPAHPGLVRSCFLFPEVFTRLREYLARGKEPAED